MTSARIGAATEDNPPSRVKETTLSTLNFAGVANCGVEWAETAQHGSELQLNPVSAEGDGACPDALMEGMATSFDMPRIGASLEGRQQSVEELPSAHIFCTHVMVAKAGCAARSTASARATDWRILFMTATKYAPMNTSSL